MSGLVATQASCHSQPHARTTLHVIAAAGGLAVVHPKTAPLMGGAHRMMAVNRLMPKLVVLPQMRGPLRPVVATEMLPESIWACAGLPLRLPAALPSAGMQRKPARRRAAGHATGCRAERMAGRQHAERECSFHGAHIAQPRHDAGDVAPHAGCTHDQAFSSLPLCWEAHTGICSSSPILQQPRSQLWARPPDVLHRKLHSSRRRAGRACGGSHTGALAPDEGHDDGRHRATHKHAYARDEPAAQAGAVKIKAWVAGPTHPGGRAQAAWSAASCAPCVRGKLPAGHAGPDMLGPDGQQAASRTS